MRFIEDIKKTMDSLEDNFHNGEWLKLILKVLLIFFLLTCLGILVAFIIGKIMQHLDFIIIGVGAVFGIIVLFRNLIPARETQPVVQSMPEPAESILQYDTITLDATYTLLRKTLCEILCENSDILNLRRPEADSQLDILPRYSVDGQIPIYHFGAVTTVEKADLYRIEGILQKVIIQKLENNEFEGIRQTYQYVNGQTYPLIMVDNVSRIGDEVRIDLAFSSDMYCKYRERRRYNTLEQKKILNLQDKDF